MNEVLRRTALALLCALLMVCTTSEVSARADADTALPVAAEQQTQSVQQSTTTPPTTTTTEAPTTTAPPPPEPTPIGPQTSELELPLEGATAYACIELALYGTADATVAPVGNVPAGSCFCVEEERGTLWRVTGEGWQGWVESCLCLINLPDVLPSAVYDDTNARASVFRSREKEIPGVTGQALYEAYTYNERFGEERPVMPVLYPVAQHLCAVQQAALARGYTLVIYEAFRPYVAQRAVVDGLNVLAAQDSEVLAAITGAPWGKSWFIAQGVSNHQCGYALDMSLAHVDATECKTTGGWGYLAVTQYTLCEMPTAMHELSPAAASMTVPVAPASAQWSTVPLAPTMTEDATLLRELCTEGGFFTPLASEWWHFNDYPAADARVLKQAAGGFTTQFCRSHAPQQTASMTEGVEIA